MTVLTLFENFENMNRTSEGIVPQFLSLMIALTGTSSPELPHSLNSLDASEIITTHCVSIDTFETFGLHMFNR